MRVCHDTGVANYNFSMYLENIGRCAINYEVEKFDIHINNKKWVRQILEVSAVWLAFLQRQHIQKMTVIYKSTKLKVNIVIL